MKLQVVSVEIDSSSTSSHGELGIFRDYVVSGINLRWAIDSLGNGRFDKSTKIVKNVRPTMCTAGIMKNKNLKLNFLNNQTTHNTISNCKDCQGYFSLKGEKVSKYLPHGIFVKQ